MHKDILKRSGLGRIVMFLFKCPSETRENRKLAGRLVGMRAPAPGARATRPPERWSRPILGSSMSYRELAAMMMEASR